MDLAVLKKISIIIKIQKKFKDSQHPPIITNRERQEGKVGSLSPSLVPWVGGTFGTFLETDRIICMLTYLRDRP